MIRLSCIAAITFSFLTSVAVAQSDDLVVDSTRKAVERYLAELEEIERVADQRKAEAKARLEAALEQTERFEKLSDSGRRFHGMLGSYFSHQGRIPFIMLSVPNGENVLSEESRRLFNKHFASGERLYKFESRGNVVIPQDGSYRLQVSRAAGIKLNDIEYAVGSTVTGEPPYADVDLIQGVYQVTFDVGNNGGQMNYSMVRIIDNATNQELPIFVYESELKEFRNDLSFGVELTETSAWDSKDNELR